MKTYIKVSPEQLISLVNIKMKKVLAEREQEIEKFIKMNVKPEKKINLIFTTITQKEVTREDVVKSLEEDVIDDFGYNFGPLRNQIGRYALDSELRLRKFINLAETAKESDDPYIRLHIDDNQFLVS